MPDIQNKRDSDDVKDSDESISNVSNSIEVMTLENTPDISINKNKVNSKLTPIQPYYDVLWLTGC